jgi:hypothetical protein
MYQLEERGLRKLTLREETEADPAVVIEVAPHTRAMSRRAGLAARAQFPDLPLELKDAPRAMVGDFIDAVTRETLRLAITSWEGIGDAKGKPIPVTPELSVRVATADQPDRPSGTIDLFLADDDLLEVADRLYVLPQAERRREKNGAGHSSNGTSAGATDIAKGAQSPAGATSALTGSTPSKPSKRKKSGTS